MHPAHLAPTFRFYFRIFSLISIFLSPFSHGSCARLFGWNIHAPGLLSGNFIQQVRPLNARIALYLDPGLPGYRSTQKGSWSADPQTYYVGEALGPMLIEAFQEGFEEFVLLEVEPEAKILKQYGIPYLAAVRIRDFQNRVTWKGQAVSILTETAVFDSGLRLLARFEATGASDAARIFAKKGGPEVNLNAALENNVRGIVEFLQDSILSGNWESQVYAAEGIEEINTKVTVKEHPLTKRPYVGIADKNEVTAPAERSVPGKKYKRPDYRMLDPKIKSGEISYEGPSSDRKKIYIFAASLAALGAAGSLAAPAAIPASASAGASGGAGAYGAAGGAVAAGTFSAGLASLQSDPEKDNFQQTSSAKLSQPFFYHEDK